MFFCRFGGLLAVTALIAATQALADEKRKTATSLECSKYLPEIGQTVRVPCAEGAPPATPGDSAPAIGESIVSFDAFAPGPLPVDALASHGIPLLRGSHAIGVYSAQPNMVLPVGREHVLLIDGGPETSLSISFNTPIKRFSLTRIGTTGGASVPTWTLNAYDANGNIIASIGEQHGLPSQPRQFSTEGSGIAVVQLNTDNRFGAGTWATWNSLPVAEFRITR